MKSLHSILNYILQVKHSISTYDKAFLHQLYVSGEVDF